MRYIQRGCHPPRPGVANNQSGYRAKVCLRSLEVSNEGISISGFSGGDLGIAGSAASRRPATRDGTGPAAARAQPEPVVVGANRQSAAAADAGELRHQPEGRTARAVATEPVGSGP